MTGETEKAGKSGVMCVRCPMLFSRSSAGQRWDKLSSPTAIVARRAAHGSEGGREDGRGQRGERGDRIGTGGGRGGGVVQDDSPVAGFNNPSAPAQAPWTEAKHRSKELRLSLGAGAPSDNQS